MASVYCPMTSLTGKIYSRMPLNSRKLSGCRLLDSHRSHLVFEKISQTKARYFIRQGYGAKYAIPVGRDHHQRNLHNDVEEPFWVAQSKEVIRSLKSLFAFLAEQPSQLKYIEWPGFQNTLKTAMLTLVLVAMLIVVLSSVDSGLRYLMAFILRKPA